jgi:hypothetical protein
LLSSDLLHRSRAASFEQAGLGAWYSAAFLEAQYAN